MVAVNVATGVQTGSAQMSGLLAAEWVWESHLGTIGASFSTAFEDGRQHGLGVLKHGKVDAGVRYSVQQRCCVTPPQRQEPLQERGLWRPSCCVQVSEHSHGGASQCRQADGWKLGHTWVCTTCFVALTTLSWPLSAPS